ncbi:MAG: MSCRAMM family adhesin SdrC [Myxococcales bacterium]|nr:MSCRAMM family adhesin SdrC [Myxococcales bacterium]
MNTHATHSTGAALLMLSVACQPHELQVAWKWGGSCHVAQDCPPGPDSEPMACDGRHCCEDSDGDRQCDSVDPCPRDPYDDRDNDGRCEESDPCPADHPDDTDADSVCDSVDNCPALANADQSDTDVDGAGDACDACPVDATNDTDRDGLCDSLDLCASGRCALGEACSTERDCGDAACIAGRCVPDGFLAISQGELPPFSTMTTEVLVAQWNMVVPEPARRPAHLAASPVTEVSWYDALWFLNQWSENDEFSACYRMVDCVGTPGMECAELQCTGDYVCAEVTFVETCTGYRLLTLGEWEVAQSTVGAIDALGLGVFWNGRQPLCRQPGDASCLDVPSAVQAAPEASWSGGVSEWVWDTPAEMAPTADERIRTGWRVAPGGNWRSGAWLGLAADDMNVHHGRRRSNTIGLRVVWNGAATAEDTE